LLFGWVDAVSRQTVFNFCLKCTIIRSGGAEDKVCKNALFMEGAVAACAAKKKAKVISKLTSGGSGNDDDYKSFGFPVSSQATNAT
jgi:hypothetical protein